MFEDLDDSAKKELLNFKINSGLFCIRSKSSVVEKILNKLPEQILANADGREIQSFINNLRDIAYSRTPAQTTRTANADLVIQQQPPRR